MGVVTLDALGPLGAELGAGGQGTVYALSGAGSPPLVYKAYSAQARAELDARVLTDMIALPDGLTAADRQALLAAAAWPRDAVTDDGQICGFTMALVPRRFHTLLRLPGGPQDKLGQTQLLLNPKDYLDRVDVKIDDRFRLELLADVARTLRLFHRLGLAVGDLSPNNLLYSTSGRPRCHFIDCDAMRLGGRSVLPQVETTDWEVPAGGPLGTSDGDAYKFALLCVRLFAGDQSTSDPDGLRPAGPALHRLAIQALSGTSGARPSLDEWEGRLREAAEDRSRPVTPRPFAPPPVPASGSTRVRRAPPAVAPPVVRPAARRPRTVRRRGLVKVAVLVALMAYVGTHVPQLQSLVERTGKALADRDTTVQARGQAARVDSLLSTSAPVRFRVIGAVGDLRSCKNVTAAVAALAAASKSRHHAFTVAEGLTVSALTDGPPMRTALMAAFQHSQAADDAYRSWGLEISRHGCRQARLNGPDRSRGDRESAASTAAKQQFVAYWNRVGPVYGFEKRASTEI